MLSKYKGFTLQEILIVVTILVILGVAILVTINPMTQLNKAFDARRRDDIAKIKRALEGYNADHEHYPEFPLVDPTNDHPTYTCGDDFLKPYLDSMPCDPVTKEPYMIFFLPVDSTSPTKFAVYAKISFKGDPYANKIYTCPYTIAATSPDMSAVEIAGGCKGFTHCTFYYGCTQTGVCQKVSEEFTPKKPDGTDCVNFCDDPTCGSHGIGETCPATIETCPINF